MRAFKSAYIPGKGYGRDEEEEAEEDVVDADGDDEAAQGDAIAATDDGAGEGVNEEAEWAGAEDGSASDGAGKPA